MNRLYTLNQAFSIRCRKNMGKCYIEVYNHGVPWNELLEKHVTTSKDEANKIFSAMKEKYSYVFLV